MPRVSLPFAAWPEADQRTWFAALEPGDILEPGGARAHCRQISNKKFAFGYGCFLAWLDANGWLDPAMPAGDRITPERVKAYIKEVARTRSTSTQLSRLEELYGVASVMEPGRDWGWIRRIAGRVRARHIPARNKRARTVGSRELYELGMQLMGSADTQATPRQRAMQFRDGLMIAFLAARPLRRRNLTALQLKRHVVRDGTGWWLRIPAKETKTRMAIEMPWPNDLVPKLELYLLKHRHFLCSQRGRWSRDLAGEALWVSGDGTAMVGDAIYDRIILQTRKAFGQSVNPHLFRDSAVTSVATRDPTHIGIAAPLLGHHDGATAAHYNQASGIEAARSLQAMLSVLRDSKLPSLNSAPEQPKRK